MEQDIVLALPPRAAVALAAVLNFVGAFLSLKVAATIAEDIVDAGAITPTIFFAGLLSAGERRAPAVRYALAGTAFAASLALVVLGLYVMFTTK
jgi:hypothetical protein